MSVSGRWYLTDPVDSSGRDLTHVFGRGERAIVKGAVSLKFNKFVARGRRIDFCELSAESVPVVHVRVAEALVKVAGRDVQLIPVGIPDEPDEFCIVNILRVVRCIDEDQSRYVGRREDGGYEIMTTMRVDPTKIRDVKIFRPWGWTVAMVVAEEVKEALESIGTVGVRFKDVTADEQEGR